MSEMNLRFHNTLTRSLDAFEPLEAGTARIYACGPTVYQQPHIGNYRTFLFNDLLHRYLEWKGLRVRFVMNLTDVDDKTIRGAAEEGVPLDAFTAPRIDAFFDDLDALGVARADHYPRATRHIQQMIYLVRRLIERGHAYQAEGGVYYDVSSFESYGRLSGIDPEELRGGAGLAARGAAAEDGAGDRGKRDERDFALWKATREPDGEVGAVWDTPWGAGRPGWHLECSVMSMDELGETFDIHTGGEDLIFPHHEDEIAQATGATGKPFVRYWLHVKHLLVNGEKMSKSIGNQYSLQDLTERGFSPAAIRYLLLSAHYRHELNFTFEGLDDAGRALRRLLAFRDRIDALPVAGSDSGAPATQLTASADRMLADFAAAMDDDLNTPAALGALFKFVRETNAALDSLDEVRSADRDAVRNALASVDRVLGVIALARNEKPIDMDPAFVDWVEKKLQERQAARGRRDFDAADAIRDELAERNVIIEDRPDGPRWNRVPA